MTDYLITFKKITNQLIKTGITNVTLENID